MTFFNFPIENISSDAITGICGVLIGAILSQLFQYQHYKTTTRRELGYILISLIHDQENKDKKFDKEVHRIIFLYQKNHKIYRMYNNYRKNIYIKSTDWTVKYRHKIVIEIANSCGRSAPGQPGVSIEKKFKYLISRLKKNFK